MFSVQPQRNNDRRETSESADRTSRNVRRSELTAPGIGEQLTVIREIRRQQTVQRLENQQAVLEDDSFADREPMKLL